MSKAQEGLLPFQTMLLHGLILNVATDVAWVIPVLTSHHASNRNSRNVDNLNSQGLFLILTIFKL